MPWSRIGGQAAAIKAIRDTIELPALHPELFDLQDFSKLGLRLILNLLFTSVVVLLVAISPAALLVHRESAAKKVEGASTLVLFLCMLLSGAFAWP